MNKGFLPGGSLDERLGLLHEPHRLRELLPEVTTLVNEFLAKAAAVVRGRFGGRITYAAIPHLEGVDWTRFDIVSVDLYRSIEVADRFADGVRALVAQGRPVAITERSADGADRSDRKVYALTPDGQQRVAEWVAEVSWPRPDLAEFHLKLIAAAAAGLADPLTLVDTQRRDLLRRLRDAQRAAMAEPDHADAALLLEGVALRLQADLRWLEACEQSWTVRTSGS
jgi:hypothetical protein